MLFLTDGSTYISFVMGWEVSLAGRNTITHDGASVHSGYTRGDERLSTAEDCFLFWIQEVGSRLPIKLLAISCLCKAVDRKSKVGFRLGCRRYVGLGANPEIDIQATSQGGSSIQVFFSGGGSSCPVSISGSV